MKFSCWTRQLAFVAIAVAVFTVGNESCVAQGGGSWGGSWGGGSGGSMGSAGGSWGSQRVFRTPVRSFFAHHLSGCRLFGRSASAGNGSAGNGSVGYASSGLASTGNGSVGYNSGGSVGSGSTGGFGSAGYQYYSGEGYASGGSAGFVSAPTTNFSVGATVPSGAACNDCFVGTSSAQGFGPVSNSSAPIPYSESGFLGSESGVIPVEQYYDSSGNVIPNAGSTLESGNSSGLEKPPTPEPAKNGETTHMFPQDGAAILNVAVPVDARVLINNRLTKTGGSSRSYVSSHLQSGRDYSFVVEAVVERNGKDVTLQQQVVMRAGRRQSVHFDFDSPVLTQVTIKVPENANIKLCGNDTTVSGSVRNFKTRLMPGQVWENYDIDVSFERDGQTVTKKQTITIEAGQKYVVDFESGKDLYVSK